MPDIKAVSNQPSAKPAVNLAANKAKAARPVKDSALSAASRPGVAPSPSLNTPDMCHPQKNQVSATALFHSSVFPVLCIDKDLKIIYANPSSHKFFDGFFTLGSNRFFDIFGKYFQIEDVKAIRAAILNGVNGFSWRGLARIKSRERPTVFTRVYIFPAQVYAKTPTDFTVIFDDVTEENKQLLRSVFMSLLEASKLKDNDTGKHITRVNYYAEVLARALFNRPGYDYVDAEFIDNIGFLASMHDVGKIGTPDDILNKEGPLSDWEWTVMKEHTKNGAFILSTYPNPMAKEIALCHHEKWNGKGYPFQIEGPMIPLSARIVAIADVYDALRMKRSYKDAMPHNLAVGKIAESGGSQFDPALTGIFLTVAEKFNEIYEANKD
ncbi:MAG: HD-GYP domain-containing protein [Spirochaetaceae bacterium]|jgi:putative two-component system response regulator|nr:HD-GYP domain-containing protein [Spirochaetaceae bacterium]